MTLSSITYAKVNNSLRQGCLVAKGAVEGVSFTAQDSMVPDNRWYGIDLNGGSACELENCRVAYTKDDNLHLGQDCRASLTNCTFHQSGDCAVHAFGCSPTMVGCRFEEAPQPRDAGFVAILGSEGRAGEGERAGKKKTRQEENT